MAVDKALTKANKKVTDFFSSQPKPQPSSQSSVPSIFSRVKPEPRTSPSVPLTQGGSSMPKKLTKRAPAPATVSSARKKTASARKPSSPAGTIISVSSGGASDAVFSLSDSSANNSIVDLCGPSPIQVPKNKGVVDLTFSSSSDDLGPAERTKQIIAEIKAKAMMEVEEELEEEEAALDLEADSDELEDLNDVWTAAMADKTRAKMTESASAPSRAEGSPTSPLSTPPTSPSPPRRTRANAHLASPTPAGKRARLSPPATLPKKESAKSNRDLNRLLKQAEKLERQGITAAIQKAEEIVNRSSASPIRGRKRTYSQSSGGSQEMDSVEGSSVSGAAVLEHLGEHKDEMIKLFERDKAERREQQFREEHGGKGSRVFWDRMAASRKSHIEEDWTVGAWKDDDLMCSVVNAVRNGDTQELTSILYWLPFPGEHDAELLVLWLFRIATRHSEPGIAHAAYSHLLHLVSTSPQYRVPFKNVMSACRDIGVIDTALASCGAFDAALEHRPLAWSRERTWIFASIVCAFVRGRVFNGGERLDTFVLLLLVAMDPVTSPELKRGITFALEDAANDHAVDQATGLAICKRISTLIAEWSMAQKALLLSLFPRGKDTTMIMTRWLAVDVFVGGTIDTLDVDSYQDPPSLSSLLDLIDYQSRSSPFGVHVETDYERLHLATQIMEIALTNVHSYLDVRENHAKLQALSEEIFTVYSKIMDIRAAHLERTEAKDALQRLSLRLRYSIPKTAPTVQAKLPFAFKPVSAPTATTPATCTRTTVFNPTQSRTKPRPRRLVA
ncbi:hypothetical protein CALVIDRAFT_165311 [Calocera viscosa TUFC12733]|uniref:Coiled-coil SMC6 And NSE5 INteracting (CANIN) domain-containing protein n=1 Tax=Calocera viscosa (strain TUFC12733) TaxID=1330018 RepID=A0A167LFL7_CALVF|nr:hypothetical protein CALVIDRAFT_165311 [Calocera viscosa TUFC12733]